MTTTEMFNRKMLSQVLAVLFEERFSDVRPAHRATVEKTVIEACIDAFNARISNSGIKKFMDDSGHLNYSMGIPKRISVELEQAYVCTIPEITEAVYPLLNKSF